MGILDVLRRKKEEEPFEEPVPQSGDFPRELEEFRLQRPPIEERPSPFARPPPEVGNKPFLPPDIEAHQITEKHEGKSEKLDLILSKLETIDARLRLIEEKLK